jgi:hypothetical protein
MVGIVSLHLSFGTQRPGFQGGTPIKDAPQTVAPRANRARKTKTAIRARLRIDVSVTEDHDTAAFGAAAVMPSHLTVRCQRQRLSFIHRGPKCPQSRQKSLSFNDLLPNGRSDWRSSPPAAKSPRFYRRGGAKSRPIAAKSQRAPALPQYRAPRS